MKKIALIDLGSNSIRFVVVQINENGTYKLLFQEKESIRLGEGLSERNELTEAAIGRAMNCLRVYAHMAHVMKVETCIAVATAAVRNAKNGLQFVDQVHHEVGFDLKIISGKEEARLGYLGVISTIDLNDFILFDLGGASIEISLIRNRKQIESVSIPIGAVTLTERFRLQNIITPVLLEKTTAYITKKLQCYPWLKNVSLPVVGIGGTVRNLAKIDQRTKPYDWSKIHGYQLTTPRLGDIFTTIASKNMANRKKIAGLSGERADIIVAGTAIIKELLALIGARTLVVSGCGLREGLFYDYYGTHYLDGQVIIPNILRHSTMNFLYSLDNMDLDHLDQVTKVSMDLYDQLHTLHGYGKQERRLLKTAASLHDIGKIINYYDHARHSAYMISSAPIYGLSQIELLMTSFIAGYHHGISSKIYRTYKYAQMPTPEEWNVIRRLATLLAIGEALDVTYEHIVDHLKVAISESTITIALTTPPNTNYTAADYAVKEFSKQFKKEFGRSLTIIWQ